MPIHVINVIYFICFIISIKSTLPSDINLDQNDYSNITEFFRIYHGISNFLSISLENPYRKSSRHEWLNASYAYQSKVVNVITVSSENKNCSIDRFLLQLSMDSRILNWTITERFHCGLTPLFNIKSKKLFQILQSHLKKLIDFSHSEYLSEFSNNSCKNEDCFVFMSVSPLFTNLWGSQRQCWFRINRQISPFVSHPSDLQVLLEFPLNEETNWKVISIWYKNQTYKPEEFEFDSRLKYSSSKLLYPNDHKRQNKLKCQKQNDNKLIISLTSGMVKYRKWSFFQIYSDIIGIKLVDIRFQDIKIAFELNLEEIVTSYSGLSPFIQTMTSIESMYGIGYYISELSHSVDCPENAEYFPVNKFVKSSNSLHQIKRGVCVFSRKSTKPLKRHFEFKENGADMNFASATPNYLLYLRFIVTLFNYDYIFDYIFHDSGVIDISVTPTGYIHVDSQETSNLSTNPYLTKFGFAYPSLNLVFPIHKHMFLFKLDLDIVEKENSFHVIHILSNKSKPMGRNMWLEDRLIKWENSSVFRYDFENPKHFLICNENQSNSRCLQVINKSPIPDFMPPELDNSINWKRFQIAVTRRRSNESSGSSMFNGVNLLKSTVDFESFTSNNDFLLNKDIVVWATIGSVHIPTIEDVPITITSGNEMKITLKPFNLFDEAPRGKNDEEIFTRNIEDWKKNCATEN